MDLYSSHKDSKWSKAPWLYFEVEKRLIGKATRVFSVQEGAVQFYSHKYPHMADRIIFTPNGVDETVFYPYSLEEKGKRKEDFLIKHGFDPQDDIILFVGRLDVQKDPMLLLDTFISLRNQRRHVRMVVVGTGTQENALRKRTNVEGLQRDVTFTGILPQSDVADLMRVSDVFLFTSAFEGMPMVVLEAQGCGLPVVSTDVGEVPRIVKPGSSGELITDRDPESLAGRILQVLGNKARYSLANCAERLDSFRAADMLQRVYNGHVDT
jgi:glycosyltransferase involved in cell wall biosynthesis